MENLPFNTMGLASGDAEALEETYKALKSKFHVSIPDDIDVHINEFELLNSDADASIDNILLVNHITGTCYLAFIKTHYKYHSTRFGVDAEYYKYKVWAFVDSKRDFGRVLIRRETLQDKIIEIIHPVELDFKEDKEFSNAFYVVTNDKDKACLAITSSFRNILLENKNEELIIETVNKTIALGDNKDLDAELVINLANVACKISALR